MNTYRCETKTQWVLFTSVSGFYFGDVPFGIAHGLVEHRSCAFLAAGAGVAHMKMCLNTHQAVECVIDEVTKTDHERAQLGYEPETFYLFRAAFPPQESTFI